MYHAAYTHESCTGIPTIFEIWIKETGWIDEVYLELNNTYVKAKWIESADIANERFSLFRVEYTFNNPGKNQKAVFYYKINGKISACDPLFFDIVDLDDFNESYWHI